MENYKHIVILTGAGISAESGLATFRDNDGLWNKHKIEDVATIGAYRRQPEFVRCFYNEMKPQLQSACPNPAHYALARLEQEYSGSVDIVTQNVDTLHEKAGSKHVWHIHGQINQSVCLGCGQILESWEAVTAQTVCPGCKNAGNLKPNIVFFGEQLLCMDDVENLLARCDLFVSVGTSGVVYPASGFVQMAKINHADTIEFNLEPARNNYLFDRHVYGKCGETLPLFVNEFLKTAKK